MQLTKQIIKFNNWFVSIPKAMKGIWDNSENRWGYKKMIFHYIEIIKDKYKNNKDKIIMGLTIFIIMLLVF